MKIGGPAERLFDSAVNAEGKSRHLLKTPHPLPPSVVVP